jgi:hypothetical protein
MAKTFYPSKWDGLSFEEKIILSKNHSSLIKLNLLMVHIRYRKIYSKLELKFSFVI